ncbi:MAG TPA: carboxypeptidase-like regulatory domain-containing protein [Ruminococcus flavefaciens]|nr:carboxypeptidase-like regulatory domain-containing protein [Ruminococcus flavefaciens]
MDNNDINSQAERYKQELMKLYGKRSGETVPDEAVSCGETDEDARTDEEVFGVDEDAPDDSAWAPHSENDADDSDAGEEDFNTRYPEPDLSELDTDMGTGNTEDTVPPEYVSEESMGDAKGYIKVTVRTGDESAGIEDATVMVTAIVDGNRLIIASGQTDANGNAPQFTVPVPDAELSQQPGSSQRPYNLFDVSVTAEGYFNARSVDVPVFEGIVSIQNFSMIPVPSMMSGNDETVTYFNQEPDLGSSAERSRLCFQVHHLFPRL